MRDIEYFPAANQDMPFSVAVRCENVIYLSGQIGRGADGALASGFEAQAAQALDNIAAVLKRAGASMSDAFKFTIMLADMTTWPALNRVYLTYFDRGRLPARSAFGCNGLAAGALLEIECWAYAPIPAKDEQS